MSVFHVFILSSTIDNKQRTCQDYVSIYKDRIVYINKIKQLLQVNRVGEKKGFELVYSTFIQDN